MKLIPWDDLNPSTQNEHEQVSTPDKFCRTRRFLVGSLALAPAVKGQFYYKNY